MEVTARISVVSTHGLLSDKMGHSTLTSTFSLYSVSQYVQIPQTTYIRRSHSYNAEVLCLLQVGVAATVCWGYSAATALYGSFWWTSCNIPSQLLLLAVATAPLHYMWPAQPVRGIWMCSYKWAIVHSDSVYFLSVQSQKYAKYSSHCPSSNKCLW